MPSNRRGVLFIVSAPSGAGKTTLVERLVETVPALSMSRSYTSRTAREGETDGVDYNYVTRQAFEAKIAEGDFLEWADVFGNLYGTSASDTNRVLASGQDLVLVIDVQGARQVRQRGLESTAIFVLPPSFEVLERRLRGRSRDSEEAMQRRLRVSRDEVSSFREYDFVVVNHDIATAVDHLHGIIVATRAQLKRMAPIAEDIVRTFSHD